MLKILLLIFVGLGIIVSVIILYGAWHWQTRTEALHSRLEAARSPIEPKTYDPRELAGLPAPVQRYFRTVLKEGQSMVAAVRAAHVGTFNMGETGEQWKPFKSTQRVITQRPGFVWNARIRVASAVAVYVHDAYIAGEGVLRAKLFGLWTVMEQPGTPELAHGELIRFFAEGAWYPTALLPSQGVVWEAMDDIQAGATLTDGTTTVRLVFQFDERGLISSVRSEGRYREVAGVLVATPWQGRFWDYQWREDMLIPLEGEVAWLLPEGPKPYWRGRIVRIEYEFAR